MFSLDEVVIITLIVSVIVGYIAYQFAEFMVIARMLNSLSDDELDRLDKLRAQLESALSEEEANKIIDAANRGGSATLSQEVVNGTTYLYGEDNTFVAQGNTAAEAALNFFNSRHSVDVVTVKCSEGKTYKIINGKIEQ